MSKQINNVYFPLQPIDNVYDLEIPFADRKYIITEFPYEIKNDNELFKGRIVGPKEAMGIFDELFPTIPSNLVVHIIASNRDLPDAHLLALLINQRTACKKIIYLSETPNTLCKFVIDNLSIKFNGATMFNNKNTNELNKLLETCVKKSKYDLT